MTNLKEIILAARNGGNAEFLKNWREDKAEAEKVLGNKKDYKIQFKFI